MKKISVTELKNCFGKELNFPNNENLLVQKRRKDTHMIFTAEMGKRFILGSYSAGFLSRADTMNFLGIDWYGCLLDMLREYDIPIPTVSPEIRKEMVDRAVELLQKTKKTSED